MASQNVSVKRAAELLGKSEMFVRIGLQRNLLPFGTALKLTESAYYTPSGKNIHGIGIDPDVEIAFDGDAYYNDGIDNQLEKGKEVLLDMMR